MATSGTGMVTPPSTNIRNAAVTGDVVCTLQSGAMVTITGETTGSDSKKWYQVSFIKDSKSYTGFIRADLVDTTKTAEDAQTAQQSDASTTQNDEAGTQSDESVAQPSDVEIIVPDNVSLKSLTISSGTITPEFSSNVTNYTIQAEESTMEIAISAVVTDSDSQITSADGFKDLQPGLNAASIVVTAADGTSQTYSFSIICGEVTAVPDEEETEEEESIEVEGAMEEVAESAEDTVDIEEYNKYKDLATKRLMIMCVLGFLLAVALVVIINLLLKIHDMNDDDDEEDEEEEEKPAPKKKKAALEKKPQKKSLFEKREYKKLDADEAKPLKTTLSQKEQVERSKQKPQKSVMMPDLREEAKAEELYESDEAYDDTGLDDDFEFEFINLDSKR
jgi:hypothetical protein